MRFCSQYDTFFQSVDSRTLVICANQRLGRFVQHQWQLWNQQHGRRSFPALPCQSLSLWYEKLWAQIQIDGRVPETQRTLLNPDQLRFIWAQIIVEDLHEETLLSADSCVDAAIGAWNNLRLYCKDIDQISTETQEAARLVAWVTAFKRYCHQYNAFDSIDRIQAILRFAETMMLRLPKRIVLIGFDNMTPLDQAVLEAVGSRGVEIDNLDITLDSTTRVIDAADSREEIYTAARWAAQQLSRSLGEQNAPPTIAVVFPNLANQRAEIESIFNQVFEPQKVALDQPRRGPTFNISAGQPLAQTPLIRTAFKALRGIAGDLAVKDIEQILGSPFLWNDQCAADALKLLQEVKRTRSTISFRQLEQVANRIFNEDVEPLPNPLIAVLKQFNQFSLLCSSQKQSWQAWGEQFNQLLVCLSWPGKRTLDSMEYQQLQHWPELLTRLAQLPLSNGEGVTWQTALSELGRLAYIPFHPQTESSPVQVLGLLEAAGLQFDFLWVAGLDYRAWPQPCQPNPFIPLHLQRAWDMPRASADRELRLAKHYTQRFAVSAEEVVFSYPNHEGDQPLQPSPLLSGFMHLAAEQIELWPLSSHIGCMPETSLERIDDALAPPLPRLDHVLGGSQVLKNQALCPFKAFAEHRLSARNQPPFVAGITPLVRGNFLHTVLDYFWRAVQHQQALLEMDADDLKNLIDDLVRRAWDDLPGVGDLGAVIVEIEKKRAKELLHHWLDVERQRQPFHVVLQEQERRFELGGLSFKIRLDRCDKLDGSDEMMVIDYKTGRTDIKHWFGDRPEEPQLPLYALTERNGVSAVAFAEVNRHDIELKGVQQQGGSFEKLITADKLEKYNAPTSWSELLNHWHTTLESLAHQFRDGQAQADPKNAQRTCDYCDLGSFCRIADQAKIITSVEVDND